MIKNIIIGVIVIGILGFGVLFFTKTESKSKFNGPAEPVALAINLESAVELSSLILVADEKGYFKDNGIDLKLKSYNSGPTSIAGMQKGEADMALAAEFPFVSKAIEDENLRILASIAESDTIGVVGRRDRGINNPSDLRGKKIALAKGTQSEFEFGAFLALSSISLKDVTLVYLAPAQIYPALKNGDVDAMVHWAFVRDAIEELGTNGVSWSAQSSQSFYWLLISSKDFVQKHPRVVERFIRALVQAEDYWNTNNLSARELVIKRIKLDQGFADYIFPKNTYRVSLSQSLLLKLEAETRWMIDKGLVPIKTVPNYLPFIYKDALNSVASKAVTIIQ